MRTECFDFTEVDLLHTTEKNVLFDELNFENRELQMRFDDINFLY